MKIFSYVVDHDDGEEPNPYFGTCTLCRCKFSNKKGYKNIVELAAEQWSDGEEVWVIGTGGKGDRSVGNGKLIYAMRVDQVLPFKEFVKKFPKKNPEPTIGCPDKHGQFALISMHFWYFGDKALIIPDEFKSEKPQGFKLEKKGPGFRYIDPNNFTMFLEWLKKQYDPGKHGEPKGKVLDKQKGCPKCKSSC